MPVVFISYSRDDEDIAKEIEEKLKTSFSTWRDKPDIVLSKDWTEEIDRALEDAFALLLICTENSLGSKNVTYEWAYAKGLRRVGIIPLFSESSHIPLPLRDDHQGIEYEPEKPEFWRKLDNDLKKLLEEAFLQIPWQADDHLRQLAWDALYNTNSHVYGSAIENLCTYDDPIAEDVLISALRHKQRRIRHKTVREMSKCEFGNSAATEPLLEIYKKEQSDWRLRENIASVLQNMDEQAVPLIAENLNDATGTALTHYVSILISIGVPEVNQHLLKLLESPPENHSREDIAWMIADYVGNNMRSFKQSDFREDFDKDVVPELNQVLMEMENKYPVKVKHEKRDKLKDFFWHIQTPKALQFHAEYQQRLKNK